MSEVQERSERSRLIPCASGKESITHDEEEFFKGQNDEGISLGSP